jgi:hypothetical protein
MRFSCQIARPAYEETPAHQQHAHRVGSQSQLASGPLSSVDGSGQLYYACSARCNLYLLETGLLIFLLGAGKYEDRKFHAPAVSRCAGWLQASFLYAAWFTMQLSALGEIGELTSKIPPAALFYRRSAPHCAGFLCNSVQRTQHTHIYQQQHIPSSKHSGCGFVWA